MNDILSGTYKGNTYRIKVECYPNTPAIKVQLLPVNAGERITMTQNLGQPLSRYQAFLCDGMLEVDSTAFMDYMEENDLGYIVDYKRYNADVFTGVNCRTAAVFQFHSASVTKGTIRGSSRNTPSAEPGAWPDKRRLFMSKITEKIAKLLALAESPYEEEAKAALLQARRLMAEHKLMPEDIEPQANKKVIQECVGVTCTKLSSPWTVYLSTLIAAHYCCRPYRSSVHGSKVSEIGFIGMEDDFKLCKLAFLYAYDCVASRCRQIRTQKGYPAKALREMCNSYGWGFCRGLSAAFQKQGAEHQEWGLVMVVPQAVEDAVSKMKRSSYKISPQSSMNHQYAAMGYADGQEFDMRRRLEPSA